MEKQNGYAGFAAELGTALASGLRRAGLPAAEEEFRIAPRKADVSWPGAIRLGADANALSVRLSQRRGELFTLYGGPLVSAVNTENGWLLFTLEPTAIDGAFRRDPPPLPEMRPDDGETVMRLFMLARFEPDALPTSAALRRAVLMLFDAQARPAPARGAAAVETLFSAVYAVPPAQRPLFMRKLGGPARLALNLPHRAAIERNNTVK